MRSCLAQALLLLLGSVLVTLIFSAYLQPAFMLDLANRLFLCM
jgi:hypothetical protein